MLKKISTKQQSITGSLSGGVLAPEDSAGSMEDVLAPFVDVRHFQFCTKRYRCHARIVQSFTCFTRALHAADHFLQ